jgi:electron transport complex protein RnfB
MTTDIYQTLAHHLDNLPGGFPPTESGVELRILRRLFTPEEAKLALHLTLIPEESRVIARRAKIAPQEAALRLEEMANKGLVFSLHRKGSPPTYMAIQYVVGIWEFQVNDLNPELVQDMEEYMPTLLDFNVWQKAPQLRTIPVGESISAPLEVLVYERAEELVRARTKHLVAPCICRRERTMVGKGCDKPQEVCLAMGSFAYYYERNGLGRAIDQQEALEILKKADEAGLVLQPGNAEKALSICCCCGCCCGVLRTLKLYPKPASLVSTPFVATMNSATCAGCGTCAERCQMEALQLEDGRAVLDTDRCIGCGLCVGTCPTDSLALTRKPESEQPYLPKNVVETNVRLGQARGKLAAIDQAKMRLKSRVDRLLAAK